MERRTRIVAFVTFGVVVVALIAALVSGTAGGLLIAGGHDTPIIVQGGTEEIWSEGDFKEHDATHLKVSSAGFRAQSVHLYQTRPDNYPNPPSGQDPSTLIVTNTSWAVCTDAPHSTALASSAAGTDVLATSYNPKITYPFDLTAHSDRDFKVGYWHKNSANMGPNHRLVRNGSGTSTDCALPPPGGSTTVPLYCYTPQGRCFIQIDYCNNSDCQNHSMFSFLGRAIRKLL